MKKRTWQMGLVCALAFAATTGMAQTTYYVANGGSSQSPFDTWAKAATNIHDAAALAGAGSTILVTNGSYQLTNTIVVATNFTVQSVNGPDVTTLWRSANSFGLFVVSNANALVAGFTLTNGVTVNGSGVGLFAGTVSNCTIAKCGGLSAAYLSGGLMTRCVMSNNACSGNPVYMTGGVLEDSTVVTNSSTSTGGGILTITAGMARRCRIIWNSNPTGYGAGGARIIGGRLENSLVYANIGKPSSGNDGGGVWISGGSMVNCTVVGNTSTKNGGVFRDGGSITNCIIYGNFGYPVNDYAGSASAVWYSYAPELTAGAQGNVTVTPFFVDAANGDLRQAAGSSCVDTGTNVAGIATDIDGRDRPLAGSSSGTLRNDMGAYEKDGTNCPFEVGFTASPASGFDSVQCVLTAAIVGTNTTIAWWGWDFDNNGSYERSGAGLAVVTNTFGLGRYSISLRVTNTVGETAVRTNVNCVLVTSSNIYVSATGGNVLPYNTWANAATNIHDAVGVALPGCAVWVTNGSYRLTNQIALYSGVTVLGVNGPNATTLWRDAAFGNFRLFDIRAAGALVSGLTLTNGYMPSAGFQQGSAALLLAGTVSNCVMAKCTANALSIAYMSAGLITRCVISNNVVGIAASINGGVMEDSTVITNSTAAASSGELYVSAGVVRRCRILFNRNTGGYGAGGACIGGGRLENSLVYGNNGYPAAANDGGGVWLQGGSMLNCTVVGNTSTKNCGVARSGGTLTNCIVYGNTGTPTSNYAGLASAAWFTCAPELTNGVQGNLTNNPAFQNSVTGNFHLVSGSPCINQGTNLTGMSSTFDLDGNPRLVGGRVDMGAYEKGAGQGVGLLIMVY